MVEIRKHELKPQNVGQKSFYKKAYYVETYDKGLLTKIDLQSYNTIVATIDIATKSIKVNGYYSRTTQRHLKSFVLRYYTLEQYTQLKKDGVI